MGYTIVVGTDGSPAAEQAVLAAAEAAADQEEPVVHVVTAVDVVPIDIPPTLLPTVEGQWEQAAKQDGNHALERAMALLEDRGVAATTHLVTGEPASSLHHVCDDTRADLLVIGKQGRRRSRFHLIGSTAERCVRQASCRVLVVPLLDHG